MAARLTAAVGLWVFVLTACNALTGADDLSAGPSLRGGAASSSDGNEPIEAASPRDDSEPPQGPTSGSSINPSPAKKPDPDLVLYYPFDETDGTIVHDRSSSGNDGVLKGGVFTTGKTGGGLRFDGTSTCVDLGTPESLSFIGTYTLAVWARIREWSNAAALGRHVISKTIQPSKSGMWFGTDAPADLDFKIGGSAAAFELLAPVPREKWVHLAASVGVDRVVLYIDGVNVASKASPLPLTNDGARVRVGCSSIDDRFFSGDLDELRVYKRALSQTEIEALAR